MASRVTPWEIRNEWLLHPSIAEVFPEQEAAAFVCETVRELVDPAQLDPDAAPEDHPEHFTPMMVALLAYACHQGLPSSRAIVRAAMTRTDFIALTAAWTPRVSEVVAFREQNLEQLRVAIARVLAVCGQAGLPGQVLAPNAPPESVAELVSRWLAGLGQADAAEGAALEPDAIEAPAPAWLADPAERARAIKAAIAALQGGGGRGAAGAGKRRRPPQAAFKESGVTPLVRAHSRGTTAIMAAFPDDEPEPPAAPEPAAPVAPNPAARSTGSQRPVAAAAPAAPAARPARVERGPAPAPAARPAGVGRGAAPAPSLAQGPAPASTDPYDDPDDDGSTRMVRAMPDDDEPPPRAPARPPSIGSAHGDGDGPASTGAAAAVEVIKRVKSNEARLVLIEAVVGAALADGELNALEKRRIEQLLRFLRVDEAAKVRLMSVMRAGRGQELPPADEVPEYDVRLYIFEHAAMMAVADGRPNEHEMRYLRRMAEEYGLDNADVREALGRASETMPPE